MFMKAIEWVCNKVMVFFGDGLMNGFTAICGALSEQSEVFLIGAIVGAFFLMMGYKETGNKITSTSILLYVILKVVGAC